MKIKPFLICFLLICATPLWANPHAIVMLNDLREGKGRAPLQYSERLSLAAQLHANDMAQRTFFNHTGSDGSSVGDRARAVGYRWCLVAENIAKGQDSLNQVMREWAASRGHYRNMVHNKVTEFGIAWAQGDIWVMVLARPC